MFSTKLENKRAEQAWVAQTMYIHVSKCKNDKIKEKNKFSNIDLKYTSIKKGS
jgi:hypothetical protein